MFREFSLICISCPILFQAECSHWVFHQTNAWVRTPSQFHFLAFLMDVVGIPGKRIFHNTICPFWVTSPQLWPNGRCSLAGNSNRADCIMKISFPRDFYHLLWMLESGIRKVFWPKHLIKKNRVCLQATFVKKIINLGPQSLCSLGLKVEVSSQILRSNSWKVTNTN